MKNRPIRLLTLGLQTTAVLSCVALWKGEARALDPSKAITQYIHETWDSGSGLIAPPHSFRGPARIRPAFRLES